MTIKKKVNFFQIFLLFFVKWLWNLHNPVQDRELPKNVLILSQNIENKWKKSFSEESKLCPCWGTVGGGTVGQYGPLDCWINSTSTFVIFCIRVDVSRVTSGYGGDMTPLSQVRLTPKNGLGSAGRFMAPIGQSHHWQGQKCFLTESHFF